jgi:hypothetical protein
VPRARRGDDADGRIFISYRRHETAYPAGWLFDRLSDRFGPEQIFKDVDSIEPGDDFVEKITAAVGSCDVLLALIGDEWLSTTDATGRRRLDDPNDFVRIELEAALTRNVRVIPILVDGAAMPRAGQLPPSLAPLERRQAVELSPTHFSTDLDGLLRVLERTLAEPPEPDRETPPSARERPSRGRMRAILSTRRRVVAAVLAALVVVVVLISLASAGSSSGGGGGGGGGDSGNEPDSSQQESSYGRPPPVVMSVEVRISPG